MDARLLEARLAQVESQLRLTMQLAQSSLWEFVLPEMDGFEVVQAIREHELASSSVWNRFAPSCSKRPCCFTSEAC